MKQVLLTALVVIVAFVVGGWLLSLLMGMLKWALILGVLALGVMMVARLFKSRAPAR